ncbi:hypothetical protein [Spirillospora sp. NPDC047279]
MNETFNAAPADEPAAPARDQDEASRALQMALDRRDNGGLPTS